MGNPLKKYQFIYQTRLSPEHDYKKILYATNTRTAWTKFNNYCQERNIKLDDASIEKLRESI